MARSPVPGEAKIGRAFGNLLVAYDVIFYANEQNTRADAILDTGSTFCVISQDIADRLDLRKEDRRGTQRNMIVGGRIALMDRHRLSSIRIGTARAYDVDCLVGYGLPRTLREPRIVLDPPQENGCVEENPHCSKNLWISPGDGASKSSAIFIRPRAARLAPTPRLFDGASRATGLPRSVTSSVSPSATLRRYTLKFCRSSRMPTCS